MKNHKVIDELTYRSWRYQIEWYQVDMVKARKLFPEWELYEKRYKKEKRQGKFEVFPSLEDSKS